MLLILLWHVGHERFLTAPGAGPGSCDAILKCRKHKCHFHCYTYTQKGLKCLKITTGHFKITIDHGYIDKLAKL